MYLRFVVSAVAALSLTVTLGVDPSFAAQAKPATLFSELKPRSEVPPLESERLRDSSVTVADDFRDDDRVSAVPVDYAALEPALPSETEIDTALAGEPSSRDEKTDVYALGEGAGVAVMSIAPKNVEVSPGVWERIDTTVLEAKDGGLEVRRHPLRPDFPASAAGEFALTDGEHRVAFSLEGASAEAAPQVEKAAKRSEATAVALEGRDAVVYEEALPGVALDFEVTTDGVKELLILQEAPEEAPVFRWRIDAPGAQSTGLVS